MKAPAVVTLTRFTEVFDRLRASVDRWEPGARKVVVTSGGAAPRAPGWEVVAGAEPFVFPRNANAGLRAAGEDRDVLLVNDDCELTAPVLETCARLAADSPALGVLSPQIDGGVGNALQRIGREPAGWEARGYYASREHLSGVCVYYPARTRALVGLLDERYDEYGCDDQDYCYRVRLAGLELGVTPLCVVRHGFGGRPASASFGRSMTRADQRAAIERMRAKFKAKFGLP